MSAPLVNLKSKIDVEDVRHFIFDRTVADNTLDLDLTFSDEEIGAAARFAAMGYNETTPYVDTVRPDSLPFGMCFLNGIAYYLYLGQLQKLTRNDIDYSAGNVTVDLNKRRIEHIKAILPIFKDEFDLKCKQQKAHINIEAGYRCY
jgi:hypothetical protein